MLHVRKHYLRTSGQIRYIASTHSLVGVESEGQNIVQREGPGVTLSSVPNIQCWKKTLDGFACTCYTLGLC